AEAKESMLFSKKTFGKSEVERSLQLLKPDFIVHLTNAQRTDIEYLAREKVSAVCCPRANAALSVGIPPIGKLLKEGVNVALGTDNVMVNSPDLFREMEFALKVTRLAPDKQRTTGLKARHVLKMTTINAAKALRLESELGSIETGKRGSMILLDLNSNNLSDSRDITASVVNRARPDDIASIFVDGEFCHG
ncbi:MAG: amidohydrolase family protein, partial [Candidatus Bathyarchaeia archaeon]